MSGLRLYHFTIDRFVPSIREHGILPIGEKRRRGMYLPGMEPNVPIIFPMEEELVWLTRHPEAFAGISDPYAEPVRIEVALEDAKSWRTIYPRYKVPEVYLKAMATAAARMGKPDFSRDWYVVEGIIPPERIVEIVTFS